MLIIAGKQNASSYRFAPFAQVVNTTTLVFIHSVAAFDFTSSLECDGADALVLSTGTYDGIFRSGVYSLIPANIAVPQTGFAGSLGKYSIIGRF